MVYLDNAASTPIDPLVLQEMIPFLKNNFGNPSSIHRLGRFSKRAIENARKKVADLINANEKEIFFTSGGTESNNTVIKSCLKFGMDSHIITSSVEHDAILEPCNFLKSQGLDVSYVSVNKKGLVDVEEIKRKIKPQTCLISIMLANNEVGTIQPIEEISKITRTHKILFHTDAIQGAGKIDIDVEELGVDFLSLSSHKIHGPKGVGSLFIKKGSDPFPFLLGGGQEKGFRSGTENVAGIVGFGKACQLAKQNLKENITYLKTLRNLLVKRIQEKVDFISYNGDPINRLPSNAHFSFQGIRGEDLVIKLDENDIFVSTGSACSMNKQKASHVLKAMGMTHEEIEGSIRLSVGLSNTPQEIEKASEIISSEVTELRKFSPYKNKYGFN